MEREREEKGTGCKIQDSKITDKRTFKINEQKERKGKDLSCINPKIQQPRLEKAT